MLNLTGEYVPSLFVEAEKVLPYFLWLSKAASCKRMVAKDIRDKPPLVAKDWLVPEEECLFDRVQLLFYRYKLLAIGLLNLIYFKTPHAKVKVLSAYDMILHYLFHCLFIDQEVVFDNMV